MQTASPFASGYNAPPAARRPNILRRAEAWLDDRGRPAWIGATVVGFVLAWPVGLGLLGWSLATGKFKRSTYQERTSDMFCRSTREARHTARKVFSTAFRSSGNNAFDAYKADTLQRLQNEQDAFESFLKRLRDAKDKQEFDRFMEERAADAAHPAAPGSAPEVDETPRGSY